MTFTDWLARLREQRPATALMLGSGMGAVAGALTDAASVPFADVPGMAAGTVVGHSGKAWVGRWGETAVLVFQGRLHFYEDRTGDEITTPARLAAAWGVRRFIATNAAGGIRDDLSPGTLMAIAACRRWATPASCVAGDVLCSPALVRQILEAGKPFGVADAAGVYGYVTGPSYETPGEIRAMRAAGVDAVGMSTLPEVEAALAAGMEAAAVSCVTNRAAGLSRDKLAHDDVIRVAGEQSVALTGLLRSVI